MARKRLQYPSVSRVVNVPVPYPVVPGGDFPKFDLVLKPKYKQQDNFNPLIVLPTPYPVVPGGDFPQFNLVQKSKAKQLDSFTNTVYLPVSAIAFQPYVFTQFSEPQRIKQVQDFDFDDFYTTTPSVFGVFSQFSQPSAVKPQSPQATFVGDRGPAQTPSSLVFADFDLIQNKRPQQEEWVRFQVLPPTPVVVQPYVFTAFGQPQPPKPFQENVFNGYEAIQLYFQPVFSTFEQPRFKQVRQDPEVQFTIFPVAQVVSTPVFTGFTDFGIPVTRKIQQPDISGTLQQQVVAVVQPYVFGQFSQPQFVKSPQPGFSNTIQPASIQTYIFSTFSQPLIKRQVNDQPTWFGSSVVLQPYVFSAFSQPRPLKYQTDANIQTSYYPIVVIPPPNFTGFNDFGLPQQLLGTQQKQDGGYVQFTVLPMPQVISPYFFTGFSDFATILLTKSTGLIGLNSDQPNVVLQPIIPPPFPVFGPGGTKRWKEGYEALRAGDAIPRSMPVVSSNISEIGYDPEKKELTVEFRTYKYENVKPRQAKELVKSDSYGKYFQSKIKGKYPTTRIK